MKLYRLLALLMLIIPPACCRADVQKPFEILVVDAETSRGIPLVKLQTINGVIHYTDSAGRVAFNEPTLMNKPVFFQPSSDGYKFDAPGLAMGGFSAVTAPGTSTTVTMRREMVAQRLYRITGAGIYQDTIDLRYNAPIRNPLLNAGVFGQDSVQVAKYKDRMFWLWGDTSHQRHPLAANYRSTVAWTDDPVAGGFSYETGPNLEYLETADGFTSPMVELREGQGNATVYWVSSLMPTKDRNGSETLIGMVAQVDSSMKTLYRGAIKWDDAAQIFRHVKEWPLEAPVPANGHPFKLTVDGQRYQYVSAGSTLVRCIDVAERLVNPHQWEAYTCNTNTETTPGKVKIERDLPNHNALYKWRRGVTPLDYKQTEALVAAKELKPHERIFFGYDVETGKRFQPHGECIMWNEKRQRWIMLVSEIFGTSVLGELWYMEAKKPEGPWVYAQKVLTHETYTYYNPYIHRWGESEPRDELYFEGTYTKTFSSEKVQTPRYDYNQIMYKLDMNDKRLMLPEPMYWRGVEGGETLTFDSTVSDIVEAKEPDFYACRTERPGTVKVEAHAASAKFAGNDFYVLPPNSSPTSHTMLLISTEVSSGVTQLFTLDDTLSWDDTLGLGDGQSAQMPAQPVGSKAVGRVWKSPDTMIYYFKGFKFLDHGARAFSILPDVTL